MDSEETMTGQLLEATMAAMAGQHLEATMAVLDLATGQQRLVVTKILDLEATVVAMVAGHHLEEIMVAMADQDLEETVVSTAGQHLEVTTVAMAGQDLEETVVVQALEVAMAGPADSEAAAMEPAAMEDSSADSRVRFLLPDRRRLRRPPVEQSLPSAPLSSTVQPSFKSLKAPASTSLALVAIAASTTPSDQRSVNVPACSDTPPSVTSSTSATTTSGSRSTPSTSSLVRLSLVTTVTSQHATGLLRVLQLNALNNSTHFHY